MVDTPFFDNRPGPTTRSHADDIAGAVALRALPARRVDVNEILIRPTSQPT